MYTRSDLYNDFICIVDSAQYQTLKPKSALLDQTKDSLVWHSAFSGVQPDITGGKKSMWLTITNKSV